MAMNKGSGKKLFAEKKEPSMVQKFTRALMGYAGKKKKQTGPRAKMVKPK